MAAHEWLQTMEHGDPIALTVLYLLIGMSFLAWTLIVYKGMELWKAARANKIFVKRFWERDLRSLIKNGGNLQSGAPFGALSARGFAAVEQYYKYSNGHAQMKGTLAESLTRVLRQAIQDGMTRLEAGIGILATIGNTAPFIGLFGTVVGIMAALTGISKSGEAGLDVVAGPIGEALIATAAGLACAIPAVVAYNSFVRRLRVMRNALEGFAHDLLVRLVAEGDEAFQGSEIPLELVKRS